MGKNAIKRAIEEKRIGTGYGTMLACVIAMFALLTAYYLRDSLSLRAFVKHPPPLSPHLQIIVPKVKSISWNSSTDPVEIVQNIVRGGVPVVIRNGPVGNWPLKYIDIIQFLQEKTDIVLPGVRWQPEPVFVLGNERDKGGMLGSADDRPLRYFNSSVGQFLNSLADPAQFRYWSGELAWFEEVFNISATKRSRRTKAGQKKPVTDWSVFKVVDAAFGAELLSGEADLWVPMVWLSHAGVVAQTHFDPQHNFLSQLQGSKRLLLFPPYQPNMYPFPHIHRSYRQSQLRLEVAAVDRDLFPTLTLPPAHEVLLAPGETLYIPPYWHHRVEALTTSVSLSVTSPASWEVAFSEMYWQRVPFGRFADTNQGRQVAVGAFLRRLVDALPFGQSLREFADWIYVSRYRPLYPPRLLGEQRSRFICAAAPTEGTPIQRELDAAAASFGQAADKIATLMGAVDAPLQLKRSFVADYSEELSRWAVGPTDVVFFLHDCLAKGTD